jgi:hypothetical protein
MIDYGRNRPFNRFAMLEHATPVQVRGEPWKSSAHHHKEESQ